MKDEYQRQELEMTQGMASGVRENGGTVNMLENVKIRESFKDKQGVTG